MRPSGMVTLLTDFGLEDPYTAMMKGAVLSINPAARIIDISHHIPAGAVMQASWALFETYPYFPEKTVHVAVVDPGVGTRRRPILVKARSHLFVGPDNGIFSPILEDCRDAQIIHLKDPRYFLKHVSNTFHGRDLFAPAAAHLSLGTDPLAMGPMIDDPVRLPFPRPYTKKGSLWGQIVRVDHFGNLITNLRAEDVKKFLAGRRGIIAVGNLRVEGISKTYGEAPPRQALALFGSSGRLEIAVNKGRAADRAGLETAMLVGGEVMVSPSPGDADHS
ncbi:MAG: hypothetical protein B5M55_03210 [Desulfococcus sp. 4484_242]|nr:MAG: hypothetical protein B5M55_03210 [Desulfococcus sp. 4484_242]